MSILRSLASLKITRILIPVLIAVLIAYTVLPGERKVYESVLFLFPLLLFLVNLGSCTVLRISRIRSWRRPLKAGPDLIHLSLLLLIIGALLSGFLRREEELNLRRGEILSFPDGSVLTVESLDFSSYEDGRPRHWEVFFESGESLQVNKPLWIGDTRMYLSNFASLPIAVFSRNGEDFSADLSQGLNLNGVHWSLRKVSSIPGGAWAAEFQAGGKPLMLKPGDEINGARLKEISLDHRAGIILVRQPLRILFLTGFILIFAGLILTLADKFYTQSKRPFDPESKEQPC